MLRRRSASPSGSSAVAILTDPGGPVLVRAGAPADDGHPSRLRSLRPTLVGRCWARRCTCSRNPRTALRSSPTLVGRCCNAKLGRKHRLPGLSCDPHRPWWAGAGTPRRRWPAGVTGNVAILTDPGGPVLGAVEGGVDVDPALVAILTERLGGPVLGEAVVHARPVHGVAILTDLGGPVLARRERSR